MQLESTERLNMGLSAGAIAACFAISGSHFASSVALGAVLEALNFRFLNGTARAVFDGTVGNERMWLAVFGLRFSMLAVGIGASLWAGVDPLGLVIGLSLVMPAVVISAIKNRPPVIESAPLAPLPPDDPSWDQYSIWRAGEVVPGEEDDL